MNSLTEEWLVKISYEPFLSESSIQNSMNYDESAFCRINAPNCHLWVILNTLQLNFSYTALPFDNTAGGIIIMITNTVKLFTVSYYLFRYSLQICFIRILFIGGVFFTLKIKLYYIIIQTFIRTYVVSKVIYAQHV